MQSNDQTHLQQIFSYRKPVIRCEQYFTSYLQNTKKYNQSLPGLPVPAFESLITRNFKTGFWAIRVIQILS